MRHGADSWLAAFDRPAARPGLTEASRRVVGRRRSRRRRSTDRPRAAPRPTQPLAGDKSSEADPERVDVRRRRPESRHRPRPRAACTPACRRASSSVSFAEALMLKSIRTGGPVTQDDVLRLDVAVHDAAGLDGREGTAITAPICRTRTIGRPCSAARPARLPGPSRSAGTQTRSGAPASRVRESC